MSWKPISSDELAATSEERRKKIKSSRSYNDWRNDWETNFYRKKNYVLHESNKSFVKVMNNKWRNVKQNRQRSQRIEDGVSIDIQQDE